MQVTIEKEIINKINKLQEAKQEQRNNFEALKEWQTTIFSSMDFLFIFGGGLFVLKVLLEEGVLA